MSLEKSGTVNSKYESLSLRNMIISEIESSKLIHSNSILNTQQSFSQMKFIFFNRISAKLNDLQTQGNLIKFIISLTLKENRSSSENQILAYYISSLKGIADMSNHSTENNLFDVLLKVANEIGYEFYQQDQIVFKKGDLGDKFYIIIQGKVSVLVAEESTINLSEIEYISYLLKLKKYGENDILHKSLSINHGIFKSISEELDKFLRDRDCDANKFLKNLPYELVKEYEDTVSYLNECKTIEQITVKEYTNRINVEIDKHNKVERKTVTIYVYNSLIDLSDGDKFGDFSLTLDIKKRTATIITLEETHLCYLTKSAYEKSFMEMNEKHQRSLINYFLKNSIFKGIDKKKFHMKYFNLLTLQKLNFREKLIKENEEGKYVYFLKSGIYEISIKKTLFQTEDLIKMFEGKEICCNDENENNYEDFRLQRFLNETKFIKITIINDQEVIGLEDMIDNKGINIFTVTSISYGCEYYRVDHKHFKTVYENDPHVRSNISNYISIKKIFFLDRLRNIKSILTNVFKNEYKKRDLLEINKYTDKNNNELELLGLGFITKKRSVMTIKMIKNKATSVLEKSHSVKDPNFPKLANSRCRNASDGQLSIATIQSHSPFNNSSKYNPSGYNNLGIIDESVKSIINLTRSVVYNNDNEDQLNKVKSSLNILRLPIVSNNSNTTLKNNKSTPPLKLKEKTMDKQEFPPKSRNKTTFKNELNLFNKSNNLKAPVYNHNSKVYNNTLFKFSTMICNSQLN